MTVDTAAPARAGTATLQSSLRIRKDTTYNEDEQRLYDVLSRMRAKPEVGYGVSHKLLNFYRGPGYLFDIILSKGRTVRLAIVVVDMRFTTSEERIKTIQYYNKQRCWRTIFIDVMMTTRAIQRAISNAIRIFLTSGNGRLRFKEACRRLNRRERHHTNWQNTLYCHNSLR